MRRPNRTATEPFKEYRGTAYLDKEIGRAHV